VAKEKEIECLKERKNIPKISNVNWKLSHS